MQNSPALGSSMRDAGCVMANGELPIFGIKSFEREVKDHKWWALFHTYPSVASSHLSQMAHDLSFMGGIGYVIAGQS